jgi:hypothetical protein
MYSFASMHSQLVVDVWFSSEEKRAFFNHDFKRHDSSQSAFTWL